MTGRSRGRIETRAHPKAWDGRGPAPALAAASGCRSDDRRDLRPGSAVWHAPADLETALRLRSEGHLPVAGGTDLYPMEEGETLACRRLFDLTAVDVLRPIARDASGLRIGACVRWCELAAARLPPALDALRAAARQIGGVQIQNVATIGGNLCNASPAADGVPPLLVLDARVALASPRGSRQLALEEFLLGNRQTALAADELLTAVLIPLDGLEGRSVFLKLGTRRHLVISFVSVAVRLVFDEADRLRRAALAVGACSPVPVRLRGLERELLGRPRREVAEWPIDARHLAPLRPIDDVRATASYRREAAAVLLARGLREAAS